MPIEDRILQEAAHPGRAQDLQEELVQLTTKIDHFRKTAGPGRLKGQEAGGFPLQELNRRKPIRLLSKKGGGDLFPVVVWRARSSLTELGLC